MSLDGPDPSPEEGTLRGQAEAALEALVGPGARLRADQWTAVEALVAHHRRALVVQRTGWGKSAVYFVATALLRSRGAGPTVIVSPLLALMRNQIAAATRAGLRAVTVNSTNQEEWTQVFDRVGADDVDLVLLSPERLNNPDFRDRVLPGLARTCGLLVVDEAHCISDWGHDFRPDYRRLRTVLGDLPADVPVLATTATANARVVHDVAEVLGTAPGPGPAAAPAVAGTEPPGDPEQEPTGPGADGRDGTGPQHGRRPTAGSGVLVLRGGLDRESLHLAVLHLPDAAHRLAWLVEHLGQLPGSGIVYTLTVAATREVAQALRAHGYEVAAYSGQTEPAERRQAEDDLVANRVKALVATSALGMGFDKPDLGFVVHLGAPSSPVAYYQQIGRAGRGVRDARVLLLPGQEDRAVWDYFGSLAFPDEDTVRTALAALDPQRPVGTAMLETRVDVSRARLEMMLKVLDVDGAVHRVRGGWVSTGRPWTYDRERYARVARVRRDEQAAMLAYQHEPGCRMRFLREQLDDPDAQDCGRCDRCGGWSPPGDVDPQGLADAVRAVSTPGTVLEARRMWPSGLKELGVPLGGRIAADLVAAPGRAVARVTDPGLGQRVRSLVQRPAGNAPRTRAEQDVAPDGDVPGWAVDAAVQVLAGWDWERRPAAVVAVGSHVKTRLVDTLARAVGEVGRLPVLGRAVHDGPSSTGRGNSAWRVRQVHGAYTLEDAVAQALDGPLRGAPVLLVDDLVDSGWTMTVVAAQLRAAGAGAVLPLALGSTS